MKQKLIKGIFTGLILIGASIILINNPVNAATVMTPDQMKAQLTEQDIKEATPISSKRSIIDGKSTDDIGMPIEGKNDKNTTTARSYPNVNNHILQKNYRHPAIIKELHTFSMFGYKTDDGLPSGVAVHYTANPNNYSARSEANYEINGGWKSAFVHTFIDAGTILNIHDTSFGAWGSGPIGNKYFTQFEMVTARNFEDFAKTTSYSAWYTAYLLQQYNLTPSLAQAHNGVGTVWSHSNITQYLGGTDHTDPDAYFAKYGYNMNQFFALVQHYYGQMDKNVASLDNLSVSGTNLKISGWHAATNANSKKYSYIFIMDANTNKEIQRIKINRTRRNDVHSAYPGITNSAISGFSINVPITNKVNGHKIRIISRYTDDARGNGNAVDYAFHKAITVEKPVESAASLDSVKYAGDKLTVRGWFADNQSVGKPYRSLIVLDAANNKELGRFGVTTINRPDVGAIYSGIANASKSGFLANIKLNSKLLGKNIRLIARYSELPNGKGNYTDYRFSETQKVKNGLNKASLTSLKLSKNNLYVHGWHVSDFSVDKPYSFIIVLDAKNNKELARYKFGRQARADVLKAYPSVLNAKMSGFNFNIPISSSMRGKTLRILSRYSDKTNGNGNTSDYFFSRNSVVISK